MCLQNNKCIPFLMTAYKKQESFAWRLGVVSLRIIFFFEQMMHHKWSYYLRGNMKIRQTLLKVPVIILADRSRSKDVCVFCIALMYGRRWWGGDTKLWWEIVYDKITRWGCLLSWKSNAWRTGVKSGFVRRGNSCLGGWGVMGRW